MEYSISSWALVFPLTFADHSLFAVNANTEMGTEYFEILGETDASRNTKFIFKNIHILYVRKFFCKLIAKRKHLEF